MTERWTFGVEPLPQTVRAAAALRRVTELVVALEQEDDAVESLLADLAEAEQALRRIVPGDPTPRVGPAAPDGGRVYVDHAFDIGRHNPCFPEYEITVESEQVARGTVTFPIAYEGPPGLVHGGFLAVFFDCVVQHHNCEAGVAGKTTSLKLDYRRPTPLVTPLDFVLARSRRDDRIHTDGTLRAGDKVVCEAAVDAIAGVRATLPAVSPRRSAGRAPR